MRTTHFNSPRFLSEPTFVGGNKQMFDKSEKATKSNPATLVDNDYVKTVCLDTINSPFDPKQVWGVNFLWWTWHRGVRHVLKECSHVLGNRKKIVPAHVELLLPMAEFNRDHMLGGAESKGLKDALVQFHGKQFKKHLQGRSVRYRVVGSDQVPLGELWIRMGAGVYVPQDKESVRWRIEDPFMRTEVAQIYRGAELIVLGNNPNVASVVVPDWPFDDAVVVLRIGEHNVEACCEPHGALSVTLADEGDNTRLLVVSRKDASIELRLVREKTVAPTLAKMEEGVLFDARELLANKREANREPSLGKVSGLSMDELPPTLHSDTSLPELESSSDASSDAFEGTFTFGHEEYGVGPSTSPLAVRLLGLAIPDPAELRARRIELGFTKKDGLAGKNQVPDFLVTATVSANGPVFKLEMRGKERVLEVGGDAVRFGGKGRFIQLLPAPDDAPYACILLIAPETEAPVADGQHIFGRGNQSFIGIRGLVDAQAVVVDMSGESQPLSRILSRKHLELDVQADAVSVTAKSSAWLLDDTFAVLKHCESGDTFTWDIDGQIVLAGGHVLQLVQES